METSWVRFGWRIDVNKRLVRVLVVGLAAAGSATVGASQRMEDGRQVYNAVCASCHDAGVDGAPLAGQPGDWVDRSDLWSAVLFEHVNQGYLNMPAKGGEQGLNEYDVDAAAEYLLNISHPELPRDSGD